MDFRAKKHTSHTMETYPALVLNADFRPLSYFPLSLWPWQDAVRAVVSERVLVVSEYDREVHSPSRHMRLPSVISLKDYVPLRRRPAFTRFNVFLRDRFTCQYCGTSFPAHDLTFDHVIPRSRSGSTTWENIVTCCHADNLRKGARSVTEARMTLHHKPFIPTYSQLEISARQCSHLKNDLHETWLDFLYWDVTLEE